MELQAETFASAEELLEEIENGAGLEILFLDIEMRKWMDRTWKKAS